MASDQPAVVWPARLLPWLALATALIASTRFFGDAIWPCPVSCQGGAHYQQLFGVPVQVPAVLALVAVAGLAWWRSAAAAGLAWAAAGASLYFLWVAWQLGLRCPYCLTVHAGVLLTAAAAAGRPWLPRLLCAVLVFLGLHLAFHPQVIRDGPEVADAVPPADPDLGAFLAKPPVARPGVVDPAIDALRRQGSAQAAYILEVAIDLHCPRCAELAGPFDRTLKQAIDQGRVEVVHRFLTRRSAPSGRDLARHLLAAADPAQARLLTRVLLGTPEGLDWAAVRSRVAEVLDPTGLEATLAGRGAAIDALLAADAARLQALRVLATPTAVMSRRHGEEVARWNAAAFDPAAMLREISFD